MKKNANDIVITAACRTPMGSFLGALGSVTAPQLGATVLKELLERSSISSDEVDEVLMGCVLPAGLGQAPARQAALQAGLPLSVGCTTLNKVCGSGMKAVMLAHDLLKAETAQVIAAGGMESMSNAPYLLPVVRSGLRLGHHQLIDHLFYDGLENADDKTLMGFFAEKCARDHQFSREQQDAYAIESVKRAVHAVENKAFTDEIAPVSYTKKGQVQTVDQDEPPFKCYIEKIPILKPAFDRENGTVTAANASSIADGAAALLLMSRATAEQHQLTPLARIAGHANHAQAPEDFTTAPIGAVQKLLKKIDWSKQEVDLFEINEAFAVVTMAAMQALQLDHAIVNVNGGACALGHPIGASGARVIVTLLQALRQRGLQRGVATLCIGGGEATAIAIHCEV